MVITYLHPLTFFFFTTRMYHDQPTKLLSTQINDTVFWFWNFTFLPDIQTKELYCKEVSDMGTQEKSFTMKGRMLVSLPFEKVPQYLNEGKKQKLIPNLNRKVKKWTTLLTNPQTKQCCLLTSKQKYVYIRCFGW